MLVRIRRQLKRLTGVIIRQSSQFYPVRWFHKTSPFSELGIGAPDRIRTPLDLQIATPRFDLHWKSDEGLQVTAITLDPAIRFHHARTASFPLPELCASVRLCYSRKSCDNFWVYK